MRGRAPMGLRLGRVQIYIQIRLIIALVRMRVQGVINNCAEMIDIQPGLSWGAIVDHSY